MFVQYMFSWWEGKNGHLLVIDCHDPICSRVRSWDNCAIILANRCVINEKLSSEDYRKFFEVSGIDGPEPRVEFKGNIVSQDIITDYKIGEGKLIYLITKVIGRVKVTD